MMSLYACYTFYTCYACYPVVLTMLHVAMLATLLVRWPLTSKDRIINLNTSQCWKRGSLMLRNIESSLVLVITIIAEPIVDWLISVKENRLTVIDIVDYVMYSYHLCDSKQQIAQKEVAVVTSIQVKYDARWIECKTYILAPCIFLASQHQIGEDEHWRSCLPVQGLIPLTCGKGGRAGGGRRQTHMDRWSLPGDR